MDTKKKDISTRPSASSDPIREGTRPDREFYFKAEPRKRVWKDWYSSGDVYYEKEGDYRVYKRIPSSQLEEADWSKAYHGGVARREFIKYGLAVVGGVIVGGSIASMLARPEISREVEPAPVAIQPFPRMRIARISELKDGKPLDFNYPVEHPHNKNFLVKLGAPALGGVGPAGDIVAFNYICTHMGCSLKGLYKHEHRMLGPCPCHYTRFDLSKGGMVIIGQATLSLPQILLEVEKEDIFATGLMRLIYGFRGKLMDAKQLRVA